MSRRSWYKDDSVTSQGLVQVYFSFLTNNTSDPATSSFRGCGGLTGTDVNGPNTGPGAVASIVRVGQGTGTFLVTLSDGYRYATFADAAISGTDGFQAQCTLMSNEGSGHTTALTFSITVINGSFAAADTTGRRVSCMLVLKDSGNGT